MLQELVEVVHPYQKRLPRNLTSQVCNIAEVTTAVQQGDLSKKITVDVRGEILELKQTINTMVDQLNAFPKEVTRVAREVGTEGRLGGQANVPGAAGTWRDLTDNVNQLSQTLTTQVGSIAEVATAVTKGDLPRSIRVDAKGEVANLKDNINEMIGNLRETTEKNREQDWLKTSLTRFTRMLQGQRDPMTVSKMILSELAPLVHAERGVFYGMVGANGTPEHLAFQAGYAYKQRRTLVNRMAVRPQRQRTAPAARPALNSVDAGLKRPVDGVDLALRIPKLGYHAATREGVSSGVLYASPGHYPGTRWPGDPGTVGIAAHNVYWINFPELARGDEIDLETR